MISEPDAPRRERLITAAGAFLLGVGFCFAMYRWQTPYRYPSPKEAYAWLFTSIPFAGLAVLIALGLRRSASLLGWIVLATLTCVAFAAAAGLWAGGSTPDAAVFLQVFYGAIVLVHLRANQRLYRPEESTAAVTANARTPRRLAIALLVCTGIAALPVTAPWDPGTGGALAFGIAFVAPLWLSAAFALRQLARDQTRTDAAAWAWFLATLVGLAVLFAAVGLSHLTFE